MKEARTVQRVPKAVKPNKAKGYQLQKQANAMLARGEIGEEYLAIRRKAEYHLGYWDWQEKSPYYGRTQTGMWRGQTDALLPYACVKAQCPNLPAGSADCIICEECP